MPIIGKLLKKTTEISYKRNFNKGKEYVNQLKTLASLMEKAKSTAFGLKHDFHQSLNESDVVEEYQMRVPITDYEEFYVNWLKVTIEWDEFVKNSSIQEKLHPFSFWRRLIGKIPLTS